MKSEVKEKVLMVENPLTGKMINILPMFEFLNGDKYVSVGSGNEGYELVDAAIQVIAVSFDERSDITEIQNTLHSLYLLRNTFGKMKEI